LKFRELIKKQKVSFELIAISIILITIASCLTILKGSDIKSNDINKKSEQVENNKINDTYLIVKINPKLMIHYNELGIVTELFQLNEAANIFVNADFKDLDINSSMDKLLEIALTNGYLKDSKQITISILDNGNIDHLIAATSTLKNKGITISKTELTKEEQEKTLAVKENYIEKINEKPKNENKVESTPQTNEKQEEKPTLSNENKNVEQKTSPSAPPVIQSQPPVQKPILKTFKAIFNSNGATSIGANTLSCETSGTTCPIIAPTIIRPGYNIVGWSTSTNGTNIINVGSTIALTSDITYYAITKMMESYIDGDAMLNLINMEREKLGLNKLTLSTSLIASAKVRAKEICTLFDHTRPDGSNWSTINPLVRGENIAAGRGTVAEVFNQWMNSEPHKENILRENFTTVGIAGYNCPDSHYHYYWAQLFGTE
jgi:Uncharacterized protein with SCP/PR1 domains